MSGLKWRWEIPENMQGKLSMNLLEFIALAITIELTLRSTNKGQKILAFTDSTSALGWLYKASFSESKPIHDKVARWLALKLMERDSVLYSQHIKGTHDVIADSLSCDHHLFDNQLTMLFKILLPDQTQKNFSICQLPTDISSWLYSLSHSLTKTQVWPQEQINSKLGVLRDGGDSCQTLVSKMNGLQNMIKNKKFILFLYLQELAEKIYMARQINLDSEAKQSSPPSQMYNRPLELISNPTQH